MIYPGQIIQGEIVGGSNDTGLFDVSVGGGSPFLYVPTAHRKDQYFSGMDCVLGFINTDSPVIISRGFKRTLPAFSTPITQNAYPWQCSGRDAWNTRSSDYEFSWDSLNVYAWQYAFYGFKNLVISSIGGKDHIYFNSATMAECVDEDGNVIWSESLPAITEPGTVSAGCCFLSENEFYAVRVAYIDEESMMYVYYDIYNYETGEFARREIAVVYNILCKI